MSRKRTMHLSSVTGYYVGTMWENDGLYACTFPFKEKNRAIEDMKRLLKKGNFNIIEKVDPTSQTILNLYLGKQKRLPDIRFNFSNYSSKEISVLKTVLRIPPGRTLSYSEIAHIAGIPRAARFVGNTMAKNRTPLLIPCHRVILSDGKPGHYGYGSEMKAELLRREGFEHKEF